MGQAFLKSCLKRDVKGLQYRPRSASSGYHTEFHEDCYQKYINPPHNDPYLRL